MFECKRTRTCVLSHLPPVTKGLMMVPRRRNARTSRRFDKTVENLFLVLRLGFSGRTNHSPCCYVASTQGHTRASGPCGGRKEGQQGRKGSVNPPCVVSTWNHSQPDPPVCGQGCSAQSPSALPRETGEGRVAGGLAPHSAGTSPESTFPLHMS